MPLGAPIGTNQGLQTREFLRIIIEQSNIPVVVDAGIGAPSHAAEAMELGADAVLVNTAIAVAGNPVEMAKAFKVAVEAGRMAYEAGLAGKKYRCRSKQSSDRFLEINRQSDLILIICFRKNLKNIPGKKRPGKSTLKTAADVELALSKSQLAIDDFMAPDFSGCREIPGTDGRIKPKIYLTKIRENHIDVYPLVYH